MELYQKRVDEILLYNFKRITKDAKSVYHLGVIQIQERDLLSTKTSRRLKLVLEIHYPIACHHQQAYPE
jgi:calcineurin-like phosphoesterase family protein